MSRKARWIVGGIIGILAIGGVSRAVGADEPPTPAASPAVASTTASSATASAGSTAPSTTAPSTTTTLTAASSTATPGNAASASSGGYLVVSVVDGDTIRVRADGSATEQKVRLIGIDAPETGSCEASSATSALEGLVLDHTVTLTMGGDGEDLDPYGRALRYVDTADGDAGLAMISGGHAIARYDSRDGYGRHDRESAYIAADAASPAYACPVPIATPTPTADADPAPLAAPIPSADDDAGATPTGRRTTTAEQAPAVVSYPNCTAARAAGAAPIYAGQPGYSSKLDRDGDGVACE